MLLLLLLLYGFVLVAIVAMGWKESLFSQTTTMRGLRRIREWNFNFICHCASLRAQGQSANFCVLVVKLERRTGSQLYVAVRLLARSPNQIVTLTETSSE